MRTATAAAVVLSWMMWSSSAGATGPGPWARATHTVAATESAHLHLIRSSGETVVEEGPVSGALPGRMRAVLQLGATFDGTFTVSTAHGEIKGHGTAKPNGSGRYESFSGTMVATGGTGRYTHARGRTGLYGTFDRKTYDIAVQTTGTLHY